MRDSTDGRASAKVQLEKAWPGFDSSFHLSCCSVSRVSVTSDMVYGLPRSFFILLFNLMEEIQPKSLPERAARKVVFNGLQGGLQEISFLTSDFTAFQAAFWAALAGRQLR